MDWNAVKGALTVIVRHTLSVFAGGFSVWASKHGFDVGSEVALVIGAAALAIVNVGWAIGAMLIKKWKLSLALNLDATATHDDLNALASTVPTITKISEALTEPTDAPLPTEGQPDVKDCVTPIR